jgi:hypothetical protein
VLSKTKSLALVAALVLSMTPGLLAQSPDADSGHVPPIPPMFMQAKPGLVTMRVDNLDVTPVKGSPFCATVTTDHTQLFADGNKIHTTEDSNLCRDSEGRTRREAQLNLLGAVQQNAPQKIITIIDPVAGFRYTFDTAAKIAHKTPLPPDAADASKIGGKNVFFYTSVAGAGPAAVSGPPSVMITKQISNANSPAPPNTENLGDQTIAGVHATGTRMTTTIPAGSMGNEQPINVVSENWYSPDLKVTVMTKHTDPWAGQLTTQFTSVNNSEPDPSLFSVPNDYKVVEENEPFTVRMPPPPPPQ